jgi:flavin reductase (DIM6/NTAB) family NADH-FMN oxidoreductase RutF
MRIDPSELRGSHIYHLMVSAIVPRPIAWTGTRSAAGVDNLAPFSFFMGVSSRPPSIALSVARQSDGSLKDTAKNVLETEAFTVSMVSTALGARMVQTSHPVPTGDSEFDYAAVTPVAGERVAAPRPAEALFAMECKLVHSHDLGAAHLLVGEVVLFHADDTILIEGKDGNPLVDVTRLDPLARLGGPFYSGTSPIKLATTR